MPRTETVIKQRAMRHRPYLKWSQEDMFNALEEVKKGTAMRHAAGLHGVPHETLRRRWDRVNGEPIVVKRPGAPTVLSLDEEQQLERYVLMMADLGVGLEKGDLPAVVLQIVDDGRDHPWKDGVMPGRDWIEGFLRRHPAISERTPEALESTRARMSTVEVLSDFYDKLRPVVEATRPQLVFNLDEGTAEQARKKVLARKGAQNVVQLTDPPMSHVTHVGCINATGTDPMPPLLIHTGKCIQPHWFDANQPDLRLAATPSGWIDSTIFESQLNQFIEHVLPLRREQDDGTLEPVVLIMDGHATHFTLRSIRLADMNGITLFKLPAHTSHILQPLDLAIFGPWHKLIAKKVKHFRAQNNNRTITKEVYSRIFRTAWDEAMRAENAQKGFETAGIVPFNPERVLRKYTDKLTPALLVDPHPELAPDAADQYERIRKLVSPPPTPLRAPAAPAAPASPSSRWLPRNQLEDDLAAANASIAEKDAEILQLQQQMVELARQRTSSILTLPIPALQAGTASATPAKPAPAKKRSTMPLAEVVTEAVYMQRLTEWEANKEKTKNEKKAQKKEETARKRAELKAIRDAEKASTAGKKPARKRRSNKSKEPNESDKEN